MSNSSATVSYGSYVNPEIKVGDVVWLKNVYDGQAFYVFDTVTRPEKPGYGLVLARLEDDHTLDDAFWDARFRGKTGEGLDECWNMSCLTKVKPVRPYQPEEPSWLEENGVSLAKFATILVACFVLLFLGGRAIDEYSQAAEYHACCERMAAEITKLRAENVLWHESWSSYARKSLAAHEEWVGGNGSAASEITLVLPQQGVLQWGSNQDVAYVTSTNELLWLFSGLQVPSGH